MADQSNTIHFGLGQTQAITQLEIITVSGEPQIIENIEINSRIVIQK